MKIGDIEMILGIEDNRDNVISIHKEYPITQFNWTLEFIFKQDRYSEEEKQVLIEALQDLLDTQHKRMLTTLFDSNTYNSAISVSDKSNRKSIVIITQVTTIGQFVNSLTHEFLHVSRHIDECNNNEELFTILGNIAGNITTELYSL